MNYIKYLIFSCILCVAVSANAAESYGNDKEKYKENLTTEMNLYQVTASPFANVICFSGSGQKGGTAPINLLTAFNIINNSPWDVQLTNEFTDGIQELFPDVAVSPIQTPLIIPGYSNKQAEYHSVKINLNPPNKLNTPSGQYGGANSFPQWPGRDGTGSGNNMHYNAATISIYDGNTLIQPTLAFSFTWTNGDFTDGDNTLAGNVLLSFPINGSSIGNLYPTSLRSTSFNANSSDTSVMLAQISPNNVSPWVVASNYAGMSNARGSNGLIFPVSNSVNTNALVYPHFSKMTSIGASGGDFDLVVFLLAPNGGEVTMMFVAVPNQYDPLLKPFGTGNIPDPRAN